MSNRKPEQRMKAVSLFSGIGGLDKGLEHIFQTGAYRLQCPSQSGQNPHTN